MGKNLIRITRNAKGLAIAGNHKSHTPVIVSDEKSIFRELREITKYFFPEHFDFDYTNAKISDIAISGLEGAKDLYNLGANHYLNIKEITQRRLNLLNGKGDWRWNN